MDRRENEMSINDMFENMVRPIFVTGRPMQFGRFTDGTGNRVLWRGAVLRDQNTQMMKETGKIVLLTATPETIYERVKRQ